MHPPAKSNTYTPNEAQHFLYKKTLSVRNNVDAPVISVGKLTPNTPTAKLCVAFFLHSNSMALIQKYPNDIPSNITDLKQEKTKNSAPLKPPNKKPC